MWYSERDVQQLPQAETFATTLGDAVLAAQSLKLADQQHAEINVRVDSRTPYRRMAIRLAQLFDNPIEARLGKKFVQFAARFSRMSQKLLQPGCGSR